jgi:hypothetical protein
MVSFYGGGPEDSSSRPVPDSVRVVCFPRLLIERQKGGDMNFYEDAKFAHAYVRMDGRTFIYDGIRAIESEAPHMLVMPRSL